MAVDLGKQVGPLPLGAWIAVVGTGVAFAIYTRRTTADTPVPMNDTSSDFGVGTGEVGGWVPTTGTTVPIDGTVAATSNIEWGRNAVTWLISQNYDAATANQAVMKALASGEAGELSASEWTLWRLVLMRFGAPPEPVFANEPGTSVVTPNPDVVPDEFGASSGPTPTNNDYALWQAQYIATHSGPWTQQDQIAARDYWQNAGTRTAELRDRFLGWYYSTNPNR